MIDVKSKNIAKQKLKDKNSGDVLTFGETGKRMLKEDSYPKLDTESLDTPITVKYFPEDD